MSDRVYITGERCWFDPEKAQRWCASGRWYTNRPNNYLYRTSTGRWVNRSWTSSMSEGDSRYVDSSIMYNNSQALEWLLEHGHTDAAEKYFSNQLCEI